MDLKKENKICPIISSKFEGQDDNINYKLHLIWYPIINIMKKQRPNVRKHEVLSSGAFLCKENWNILKCHIRDKTNKML